MENVLEVGERIERKTLAVVPVLGMAAGGRRRDDDPELVTSLDPARIVAWHGKGDP